MIVIFKTVAKRQDSQEKLERENEKNENLGLPLKESTGDDKIVSIGIEMNDVIDFDEGTLMFNDEEKPAICCRTTKGEYLPHFICTLDDFLEILKKTRSDLEIKTVEEVLSYEDSKEGNTSTT